MTDLREAMARAIRERGLRIRTAEDAADAALAAIDAAGWQCVPKVATEQMRAAACELLCTDHKCGRSGQCQFPWVADQWGERWDTMLTAAPKVAP